MQTMTAATLAKSRATTIARGATLLTTDGYAVVAVASKPAVYTVTKPADRPVKAGEKAAYTVDLAGATCDCAAFAQHRTCKHLVGVTKAVADALALVGPMLPEPIAVKVDAPIPTVSKVGKYSSDQWKKAVAADFG